MQRTGRETVLVVEDDEPLAELISEMLRKDGYDVHTAGSAEEARRVAGERNLHIDLLLTDIVMPETSGRELAEQMHVERPAMKILYMSGYTDEAILHHGVGEVAAFIAKPFTQSALSRKLREVLDDAH